jgi:hypothetical protein
MPPRKWEPIFDGAVGAAQRVGKCVLHRRGVGIPGSKVATGTPSRQRAASMMVAAIPQERASERTPPLAPMLPRVGGSPGADGFRSVLSSAGLPAGKALVSWSS